VNIEDLRPWFFLGLSAMLFLTLIWLLTFRKTTDTTPAGKGATPVLIAAVVCAFFSEANEFELFKFSAMNGMEAKMRATVTEAQVTVEGLRSVAEKILQLLADLTFHDQNAEELAKDFAYYTTHGKQRRPEIWAARDDWGKDKQ
jgi:hypothetical protein